MKKKLDFKTAFWIFIIGSIAGVFIEMFYCMVKNNYIASRQGVIYGPFNPLYGVGAALLAYFLLPIRDKKDIYIFFGSFVIGSLVEYVFHFGQAFLFDTYSWDYSQKFMNVNGRIDLFHSICWGILGIIWIRKFYPWVEDLVDKIKPELNRILIIMLTIFMTCNILISSFAVARWSERTKGLEPSNNFEEFLDKHYDDQFLEHIYPNMQMIVEN